VVEVLDLVVAMQLQLLVVLGALVYNTLLLEYQHIMLAVVVVVDQLHQYFQEILVLVVLVAELLVVEQVELVELLLLVEAVAPQILLAVMGDLVL
jgi:hypothetical protein